MNIAVAALIVAIALTIAPLLASAASAPSDPDAAALTAPTLTHVINAPVGGWVAQIGALHSARPASYFVLGAPVSTPTRSAADLFAEGMVGIFEADRPLPPQFLNWAATKALEDIGGGDTAGAVAAFKLKAARDLADGRATDAADGLDHIAVLVGIHSPVEAAEWHDAAARLRRR